MTGALIEALLGYQTGSGAFRSSVSRAGGGLVHDETCLFTAQVCLILLRPGLAAAQPRLQQALDRGLGFVESCADPGSDWFRLYPFGSGSGAAMTADLPNTALAWLALLQAGRRTPAAARRALAAIHREARIAAPGPGDPDWVVPDLCRSRAGHAGTANPADLIANIHLAACGALAGLPSPPGVIAALNRACAARDLSAAELARISPYAGSPAEIEFALEQAVRAGQDGLVPGLKSLRARKFGRLDRLARRPADRPLHCQPGGQPLWYAPALQLARWLYDLSPGARPLPAPLHPSL